MVIRLSFAIALASCRPPVCPDERYTTEFDPAACGLCVGPHERMLGGMSTTGLPYVTAVATPEGLIVHVGSPRDVDFFFVSLEGEVIHHRFDSDLPEIFRYGIPLWVPGTNRVWMVTEEIYLAILSPPSSVRADMSLMEYGESGFHLIARGAEREIIPTAVMGGGELVGRLLDGIGPDVGWAVLRPLADGNLELANHPDPAIGSLPLEAHWPMPDGGAALVSRGIRYHFGPRFEELSPPVEVGPEPLAVRPRANGSALVLGFTPLGGRLFVQDVGADGSLRWEPPGRALDPDGTAAWNGRGWARVWETSGRRVLASWRNGEIGTWSAGVDAEGNLVWPEPRILPQDQELGAVDGTGNAYFYDARAIERLDENGDISWVEPVFLPACDDGAQVTMWAFVGAIDEGIWVVYEQVLVASDGLRTSVTKVTLVHADGTFAW